jgi:DNA (cytosine-5)-methyltransferase 1
VSRLRVLDLFCSAGGAGYGYHLAGYDVVGVDIERQPRYPFEFHQADALQYPLDGFELIHASPPCQDYSATRVLNDTSHSRLIEPVRARLRGSGIPYVIENVQRAPLLDPVELGGLMFGLMFTEHRLFEAPFVIPRPSHPVHARPITKMGRPPKPDEYMQVTGNFSGANEARQRMGIGWMTRGELAQAIPPAYTRHVGLAAIVGQPALAQGSLWEIA